MYVDNNRLKAELTAYRKKFLEAKAAGRGRVEANQYIGETIIMIAENLAKHPSFCGYSFVDEMVSDGIYDCVLYAYNYNEEVSPRAFAYLTQICWKAFVRRIKKEVKRQGLKDTLIRNSGILDMAGSEGEISPEHLAYIQSLVDRRTADDVQDSNYVKSN